MNIRLNSKGFRTMKMLKNVVIVVLLGLCSITLTLFGFNDVPQNPKLSKWIVGNNKGIKARFGANFYDIWDSLRMVRNDRVLLNRFMYSIAEQPLTEKQIITSSSLTQSRVSFYISKLGSINLIKNVGHGRWALTIPVFTDNQIAKIKRDLEPMAKNVAQYMKKESVGLKTLYEQAKTPSESSWEDVSHLIIDNFIVDGEFLWALVDLEKENSDHHANGIHESGTPIFIFERGPNLSILGTNMEYFSEGKDQRNIYILHGKAINRFGVTNYMWQEKCESELYKITPDGDFSSFTDTEIETWRKEGWIVGDKLMVPVVKAETIKSFWPAIEKVGKKAAKVAFENFGDIVKSFNDSPHAKFLKGSDDYIQFCFHILFGMVVENMKEYGVVAPVPDPTPGYFGVYFIFGNLRK